MSHTSGSDVGAPRPGSILGTRVRRLEDPDLVVGRAAYLADVPLDGALYAAFVRSDVAHGRIRAIDADAARALPGVFAVLTAAELGVAPFQAMVAVHDAFARPALADGTVQFVGDPYAVVLAETRQAAADGAAAVYADVDPEACLIAPEEALAPGAPVLYPAKGSNIAMVAGDPNIVDLEAISDRVVRGRFVNQRMAVVSMEPDGCAAFRDVDGRLRVWVSNQVPHMLHKQLCVALDLDEHEVRIVTPQIGGGFGGKAGLHAEHVVVAAAALRTDRPVVWVPTRSEDLVSLPHGRGQIQYVELGVRNDGTFTGLRVRIVGDAGAYPGFGAMLPMATRRMAQGTYAIPQLQYDVIVATTNTTPVGAYRGAGRPEATALLERIVDLAAAELDVDPLALRRQNLLPDDVFPFTTHTGVVYDSGRYGHALSVAAASAGYDELRAEQRRRREIGDSLQLGIGVACYVEITAGGDATEYANIDVDPDGIATISVGTVAHGQGHHTSFAMIVSDQTGIALDHIRHVDGDTAVIPKGGGTGGSRSLQLGGSAVHRATEVLIEQAREMAAQYFEANPLDVEIHRDTGTFGVAGVPARTLTWAQLAAWANDREEPQPLTGDFTFDQGSATFPSGAHICVVEVDTETGAVRIRRHVAADDCGRVLNPLIVEGQQHGGIAAGIGQALYEHVRYDEDGNPQTSTLADYGIPSSAELPYFTTLTPETPSPLNPLGAKGIGESATIGSTPAIQNAVIDALAHLGVRHIDMPCTPEQVWRAIADARAGAATASVWRPPPEWCLTALRPDGIAVSEVDEAALRTAEGM